MKYVVVQETDNFIMCLYLTENYLEAVGYINAVIADEVNEQINVKHTIDAFYELEAESGWGWCVTYEDEDSVWKDTYYLLTYDETESESGTHFKMPKRKEN